LVTKFLIGNVDVLILSFLNRLTYVKCNDLVILAYLNDSAVDGLWRPEHVLGDTHAFLCTVMVKPSGYCACRQCNMQQFHVLPTQCIYVFCMDLRTNSDYFPIQH
jgi:hypothetical protein